MKKHKLYSMKTKKLSIISGLIIFSAFLFTFSSCKKDDSATLCADEDMGTFRLLENAIESIPYTSDTKLFFQDSLGNEISMEVEYENGGHDSGYNYFSTTCEYDSKLEKQIITDLDFYEYKISEVGDSINMNFKLDLRVDPFNNNFGVVNVSDKLLINQRSKTSTNAWVTQLIVLVNQRDLTDDELSNFPEPLNITLLGREFENVYYDYNAFVYYNYSQGLIAFRDWDNKLWVLDRAE